MKEAVIFSGIQASGKTTFYYSQFAATHIRINLDQLKTRHREDLLLQGCLRDGLSFVVDNTNVLAAERARYIRLAKPAGYCMICYYFPSDLADALRRNQQRSGKECIPEKGILAKYHALQVPQAVEGFDRIYIVTIALDGSFAVE